MPAVRINIYPTTRSIMTHLNHPNASTNELWRSNAYETLDELRTFFQNPRIHTGKGYRNASQAVRGCVSCGQMKHRTAFSNNQWRKGPDANKCIECQNGSSTTLTVTALKQHNQIGTQRDAPAGDRGLERRQFNCPMCPKYGRGTYVFFKKVPQFKPLVKCPQCKRATRGKCIRLAPVPRDKERGYGLFKCNQCNDKWGSSRAVANIGQECFTCASQGRTGIMVTPFRLEVVKKKSTGTDGRRMRRVPREPIPEDQTDQREYSSVDRERNVSGANEALVLDGRGVAAAPVGVRSYDLEPRLENNDSVEQEAEQVPAKPNRHSPPGYRHKCAGCAMGLCKRQTPPKSQVHDVSDGNTVSTSVSVVTNSSVDKTEYLDRDEDFSGCLKDEDSAEEQTDEWVQV
eukprot:scaffold1506_cov179-Amphora_coffeaeformis.AAC.23